MGKADFLSDFPVKKVTESINVFIFYGGLFFEGDFCIMIKQAL